MTLYFSSESAMRCAADALALRGRYDLCGVQAKADNLVCVASTVDELEANVCTLKRQNDLTAHASRLHAYHGTVKHFSTFAPCSSGIHVGTLDQAAHVATQKLARMDQAQFAALVPDSSGWRGIILRVCLTMQKTKRVQDVRTAKAWAKQVALARREGFDSLVYLNEYEGRDKSDSYVVFNPQQITITGLQ